MDPSAQSVENICNLLIRSRLLQAPDVQLMHRRWRLESREAANDVPRFTKWLVTNQYVTEFQAQSLARGHADHFFLGQYKLLDRVGKGRMAGVYKAVHNLGHIVAIKVLPPSKARDPQILGRFQREARLTARLKHTNIVRAFHMGNANGLYYHVMEYIEGEILEDVLKRRGKLPIIESTRLVYQTLQGLQHIHEQGLVHRDVKPSNLMLVPAPTAGPGETTLAATVKILDIGLGRALFDESISSDLDEGPLTTEGAVLGTPDYLAPEQARDAHKVDIRADIYSLGCMLYHLLTGQVPFPDKSPLQQIVRHATEAPKPLRELEPAIPEPLQQVVLKMMAKKPDERYPTPEKTAQALAPFLPKGELTRPQETGPQMQSYLKWVDTEVDQEEGETEADAVTVNGAASATHAVAAVVEEPAASHGMSRRDYVMLAVGMWLGGAGVLIIEGILYLLLHRGS